METPHRISILGCGWLGLPLGARLAEAGYVVKGSTTTPEKLPVLRRAGIEPYLLRLAPEVEGQDTSGLFATDVLFLNVPPPRASEATGDVECYHCRQIRAVLDALGGTECSWIIFASSTSVYPDVDGEVEEKDAAAGEPSRASGRALRAAEELLQEASHVEATILRFGGLYGYDRQPGRFLAGRTGLKGGERPVNLIHRDDGVGVVRAVIEREARGEVFNACAGGHPTRRAFYTQAARRLGLDPPTFTGDPSGGKRVSSRRLKTRLGYRFQHPDPMAETP